MMAAYSGIRILSSHSPLINYLKKNIRVDPSPAKLSGSKHVKTAKAYSWAVHYVCNCSYRFILIVLKHCICFSVDI